MNKGKAIPVQAWTCLEGSRRFRHPEFKTAHECGKGVSLYTPVNILGTYIC